MAATVPVCCVKAFIFLPFAVGLCFGLAIALGRAAAVSVFPGFDVIMTAEEAGFYKPHRAPYTRALEHLGTSPQRTLFVAGSPADVPGASALGMPVYWHNRIGLATQSPVAPTYQERSLQRLTEFV